MLCQTSLGRDLIQIRTCFLHDKNQLLLLLDAQHTNPAVGSFRADIHHAYELLLVRNVTYPCHDLEPQQIQQVTLSFPGQIRDKLPIYQADFCNTNPTCFGRKRKPDLLHNFHKS